MRLLDSCNSSLSSLCFICALITFLGLLSGFVSRRCFSQFRSRVCATELLFEFISVVLLRVFVFALWILQVPIAVLSYTVLIFTCKLGIIGRAFNCENFLIGSHSPPLWSPFRSFTFVRASYSEPNIRCLWIAGSSLPLQQFTLII